MRVVKRIAPVSCVNVSGLLFGICGLILGVLFSVMSLATPSWSGSPPGWIFGPLAILVAPILYGVAGWLEGLLFAWLYNVASKYTGGLRLEVEDAPPATNASV